MSQKNITKKNEIFKKDKFNTLLEKKLINNIKEVEELLEFTKEEIKKKPDN